MKMPAGRKKVAVSKLFNDVFNSEAKVPGRQCKFCQTSVAKNGTRMKTRVEKCFLCPKSIKDKYLFVNSNENDSDEENQTVHGYLIFLEILSNQFQRNRRNLAHK